MRVRFVFALTVWLAAFLPAMAQSKRSQYSLMIDTFEAHLQTNLVEYRLIRKPEDLPGRMNATYPISVETNPSGAMATLHTARTGEPLETCKTPCELHIDKVRDYVVVLYKEGHWPQPIAFAPGRWVHDKRPIWLGIDYLQAERDARKCWVKFKRAPKVDGEAEVCVRVPPVMPPKAKQSGHCIVSYDVTEKGRPANITAKSCTDKVYEKVSVDSVKWWFHTPKVDRGQAVTQKGLDTKITFRLTDEEGDLIPEPGE